MKHIKTKSCNYIVTVDKDCIKRAGGKGSNCAVALALGKLFDSCHRLAEIRVASSSSITIDGIEFIPPSRLGAFINRFDDMDEADRPKKLKPIRFRLKLPAVGKRPDGRKA